MILGIGTDLVNIERVRKVLDRFGERFENRVFSELEIQRSRRKYDPSSSYAKRWAAKEACSKALGIGLRMGISWKEMHIKNLVQFWKWTKLKTVVALITFLLCH